MTHLPLQGALSPLGRAGKAPSTLLNGLLRYYKHDEASGTRVDSVGGLNLADNNTVTQAVGKVGNAGQFTAANSEWLSGSDSGLVFAAVDFSVSVWVYADAIAGAASEGRGIISVHNNDSTGDWHISVLLNRAVSFDHWKSNGADSTGRHDTTTTPITDSTFHHIVCRRTSGVYTIWVNGSNQGLAAASSTTSGWTSTDLNVGRMFTSGGYYWNGRIDELAIYNRAITDSEVSELNALGIAGQPIF